MTSGLLAFSLTSCANPGDPVGIVDAFYAAAASSDCDTANSLTTAGNLTGYCQGLHDATVKGRRLVLQGSTSAGVVVNLYRPRAAIQHEWSEHVTLERRSGRWLITGIDVAT